jgi:hypothetical protein
MTVRNAAFSLRIGPITRIQAGSPGRRGISS